jgi:NADH-quinone oxidoreductase subunit L
VPLALLATASLTGGLLVGPIIRFLGAAMPEAPVASQLTAALAPFLGLAFALAFVPALSAGLVRVHAISRGGRREARRHAGAMGPFVKTALWLSRGARVDHLYQVAFVMPFVRLVRWLNGFPKGLADPVGSLPVLALLRAKEAIAGPLSSDGFDLAWMGLARGIVRLWAGLRRLQTGRTRDYAFAMALGIAALLLLGWGST